MLLVVTSLSVFALQPASAQSVVSVKQMDGKFQLLRNGQPYRVKGVGGDKYGDTIADLKAAGGNSIRTWSPSGLDQVLSDAQKNGVTVCVGMWLGHERHGFDYNDAAAVKKQFDYCINTVRKYKNHPAVLLWGVGNEMEADGNNPKIWQAVNAIAKKIKQIDPNHPTMTVIAEIGENANKLKGIGQHCPDIDIVGVNSYGGIPTLGQRYRAAGVNKPYIVTEHGPVGPWETGKTAWKSPIEATSTEKGKSYASGYRASVASQSDICFGSYAFLWGEKQETTATWFGMHLPDGSRLAPLDAMQEAWTGSPPKNRCPEIVSFKLNKPAVFAPGNSVVARVDARDPDGDSLNIKWVLRSDGKVIGAGGDRQEVEKTINRGVETRGNEAIITIADKGSYRIFAYIYDGKGNAAVANIPLSVAKPKPKSNLPQTPLPYAVYEDGRIETAYIPSGFMGSVANIAMKFDSTDNPHSGKTCLKAEYKRTSDWGGVLWQSPSGDWDGVRPGGLNLSGATHLEFWVRGAKGGEVVNFVFGVLDGDQPYGDTAKGELKNVKLKSQWQKMSFPLDGLDLGRIKTGFGWSLAGQADPVTFYLDDIRYVTQ